MQEEQPDVERDFLKEHSEHQAQEEPRRRCERRAEPCHAHAQNREDTEMQHGVNDDESGGDLRELMVQQNAGEQRGVRKG